MINRATDKIYETILELIDKNISNIKILIDELSEKNQNFKFNRI